MCTRFDGVVTLVTAQKEVCHIYKRSPEADSSYFCDIVTALTSSICDRHRKRSTPGRRLLHGVKPFEFDTRVRRGKLPTDRPDAQIALLLPLLDTLKKLLNRVHALIGGLPG